MSHNNSTDFSNGVPTAPFQICVWPLGIELIIGGLAGAFGNTMVIMALITSTELRRNRCNTLVGHLALADLVSCSFIVLCGVSLVAQALRPIAISNQLCYYALAPCIASFNAGSLLVLIIGIDRTMSLWKPVFYKNLSRHYINYAVAASWLFGLAGTILGYFYKDPHEIVLSCAIPTALRGAALSFWNYSNILINILVVVAYSCAYHRAKALAAVRTATSDQILRNNRLLTSLIVCVSIYIIGWAVTMLVIFLVNVLSAPLSVVFHASMYVGALATLHVGSSFYVYYCRSDDYRRAFKKIMRLETRDNQVTPHVYQ